MTRKVIGYDLNGWRDLAVRNWLAKAGDGEDAIGEFLISGGLGTVIRAQTEEGAQMVGGIAAQVAPHGRGGGWGEAIGNPDLRVAVKDLVVAPDTDPECLSAAIRAMGGRADVAVVSIDDAPGQHDDAFDGWIMAMRKAGHRRGLHVWRPVLTALWALESQKIDGAEEVAVLSQGAHGLYLQELRLRSDSVRAPERQFQGKFLPCALGFQHILDNAKRAIERVFPDGINRSILDTALSLRRLAIGLPSAPELLRRTNGTWAILPQLPAPDPVKAELPPEVLHALDQDRPILLETIATGPVRKNFFETIRQYHGSECHLIEAPEDAVACGAFFAARRAAEGIPIYYDFLPQISTIVQPLNRDPISVNLIPPGNPLPAGQIYRSPVPARFYLQHNQETISIYLLKELDDRPRQASVRLPIPARTGTTADLIVEQAPAEGKARLILRSDALPTPLIVDWWQAEPTKQATWDELLTSLARPRPTIPARLVLPATEALWRNRGNQPGLAALLRIAEERPPPDWERLAGKLDDRINGREYCLSSDGDFPANVTAGDRARLETLHGDALNHALDRARGRIRLNDNASLKFLTWLHKRCDRRLLPELLKAMEAAEDPKKSHPFIWHGQNAVLIYQGLGRIIADHDGDAIDRVFAHLRKIPPKKWYARRHVACAAFLLSRTDEAPKRLTQTDVDVLTGAAVATLGKATLEVKRQGHSGLHYPPFLMAGLIRSRLANPWALVVGNDRNANRMLAAIQKALPTFERFAPTHRSVRRLYTALIETAQFLQGEGRNPNLLIDIETVEPAQSTRLKAK